MTITTILQPRHMGYIAGMDNSTRDGVQELDARGLICPLPVLRARKALLAMAAGDMLRVYCTDPAAASDFPAFCRSAGHVLLESGASPVAMGHGDQIHGGQNETLTFLIQRGPRQ